jgi:hypothetical protein
MSSDDSLLTKMIGTEFRRIQSCTVLRRDSSAFHLVYFSLCLSFAIKWIEMVMNSQMMNTKMFEQYSDLPYRQYDAHPTLSTPNRHSNPQSPYLCNDNCHLKIWVCNAAVVSVAIWKWYKSTNSLRLSNTICSITTGHQFVIRVFLSILDDMSDRHCGHQWSKRNMSFNLDSHLELWDWWWAIRDENWCKWAVTTLYSRRWSGENSEEFNVAQFCAVAAARFTWSIFRFVCHSPSNELKRRWTIR